MNALDRGEDFDTWHERTKDTLTADAHAETVFRNQTMNAYNSASKLEMEDDEISDLIWGYEYSTMDDDRVRPTHQRMHGYKAPANDPVWSRWWPPNGHNCRCMVTGISTAEAEVLGIKRSKKLPKKVKDDKGNDIPMEPDEGFKGAPE